MLKGLYQHQPWRNSMQLFLDGPADIDKITIFLSHQPSSDKHKLTGLGRESIIKNLILKSLVSRVPTQPPRFLIGGDLNVSQGVMYMAALAVSPFPAEIVVSDDQRQVQGGDEVLGINMASCK